MQIHAIARICLPGGVGYISNPAAFLTNDDWHDRLRDKTCLFISLYY